jgi:hypothetical protein
MSEKKMTSVVRIHMTVYGECFTLKYLHCLFNRAIPAFNVLFHILATGCSLIRRAGKETKEKKTWKNHFWLF